MAGIGGQPDVRQRQQEFESRDLIPNAALIGLVSSVVDEAKSVLVGLTGTQLAGRRTIQGFDVTVLQAIHHTTTHFVGHTHQIIYITRLILGNQYRMQWSPDLPRDKLPI
jgi:hypothetical protein